MDILFDGDGACEALEATAAKAMPEAGVVRMVLTVAVHGLPVPTVAVPVRLEPSVARELAGALTIQAGVAERWAQFGKRD